MVTDRFNFAVLVVLNSLVNLLFNRIRLLATVYLY